MKRIGRPPVVPLLIALGCVGLLVLLHWRWPLLLVSGDIGAGDYLLLREDGPHWGQRRVRGDVVLVMIDRETTRARNGGLPSFADDLRLYRGLIDAGARVVADTHMIAAADESAMQAVRPLLDGMLELRGDGTLIRDIWTPSNTRSEDHERWASCIAPIVTNMHPSMSRAFETRLFPLVTFMHAGPVETMPLRIVRGSQGLAARDRAAVDAELERCGIMVSWATRDDASEYRTKSPPYYRVGELPVPWSEFPSASILVPPAAFWVSYDAPPSRFQRYSYQEMLEGQGRQDLAGKIVIIGSDARIDPSDQTFTIPTSLAKTSIAEVVGAAVQTLLDGRFPRPLSPAMGLIVALCLVTAVTMAASLLRPLAAVVLSLVLLASYLSIAVIAYRQGWLLSVLSVPVTAGMAGVLGGAYQLFVTRQARSRIVDLFGRYVPRAVVQQLVQQSELKTRVLGGVRRNISVMFADIRGFTTFSEQLEPEQVLIQLNSLLEGMVACTFEAEGTLDKFIGDAILVLFNAPLEQPDHACRAVATALEIQARVAHHPSGLSIGIGIHTGDAVVGNIGTPERMEYTAIGSTVNIASRLCDAARPGEIIVSTAIVAQVAGRFRCETRPPIRVKGIDRELEIHVVPPQSVEIT